MRFLFIFVVALAACEHEPKPAAEPPGPPPAEIKFPAHADSVRWTYFDRDGKPVVVGDLEDVPVHLHDYTGVLLGERTRTLGDQLYRWRPELGDERIGVAQLTARDVLEGPSVAAWHGADLALVAWESAMIVAGGSDEPLTVVSRGASKRPKSKRAATESGREPRPRKIEISSVNGTSPSNEAAVRAARSNAAAPSGWKDVTIYYDESCGWCRRAMRWMDSNSVPYRKRNVDDAGVNQEMWAAARRAGKRRAAVPMFVVGSEREVMTGWRKDEFVALAKR